MSLKFRPSNEHVLVPELAWETLTTSMTSDCMHWLREICRHTQNTSRMIGHESHEPCSFNLLILHIAHG